jgi:UBX domain-containing protein 1
MTQATEAQARFFLESTQWDLQSALIQYFESNSGSTADTPAHKIKQTSSFSKFRTMRDLVDEAEAEESHSDSDEHENLYAGGEKSGMVVQGPNKKGHSLVDDILKKAEEGGTYEEEEEEMDTMRKKPKYYTGTGYRLGSEDEPSSQSIINQEEEEEELEPAIRHLTFWRNGFSVDDGPLYEYSNPVNQHLLTAIHSGRAPLSLLDVQHGQPVEVRVIKRQEEDYIPPPKAPPKPFEGTGHRLGSEPTTPVTESTSAPSSIPSVAVDQTQPVTSIQIRLGDGSRLIAKLNHTHTIGDIRQYIEANSNNNRHYILQTTFPVQPLEDNDQTIKEAGLLNSVIVQRYQ